jgi:hypothetical protein
MKLIVLANASRVATSNRPLFNYLGEHILSS